MKNKFAVAMLAIAMASLAACESVPKLVPTTTTGSPLETQVRAALDKARITSLFVRDEGNGAIVMWGETDEASVARALDIVRKVPGVTAIRNVTQYR